MNGGASKDKWAYKLTYDHDLELKKPWYYQAWLIDDDIQVEYTPSARAGMYRFTFPGDEFSLIFQSLQQGTFTVRDNKAIEGMEEFMGMKAFIYGVWDVEGETGTDQAPGNGTRKLGRAWISGKVPGKKDVKFKYGFSFISVEQAKKNLEKEIPDWDMYEVKNYGKKLWEQRMNQISVQGGTKAQKRTFYTALYRTYERMIDINEYGKYYSAYDHKVHESDRPFYVDDWVWDTYLAHHPLRMILHPDQESDMLQSYVEMYNQGGWMPQFPLTWGDNPAMNGFHSSIVMLDA